MGVQKKNQNFERMTNETDENETKINRFYKLAT